MDFLLPLVDLGFTEEPRTLIIVIQYGSNTSLLQEGLQVVPDNGFG